MSSGGHGGQHEVSEILEVPGARLRYTVMGRGPLLLLIPGGAMECAAFADLQAALADRWTVVRYDSRGIGESPFDGAPQDITVAGQADDALALLAELSPDEPVLVYGNSGGAVTGLELVTRRPDRVRRLIAHEPPVDRLLPDADVQADEDARLIRIYREQGAFPAMLAFLESAGLVPDADDDGPPPDPAFMQRMVGNFDVFFGRMWDGIAAFEPDLEALRSRPVVVAVGVDSDNIAERAARALAERLGQEPVAFVGEHVGFTDHPQEFAEQLDALLR